MLRIRGRFATAEKVSEGIDLTGRCAVITGANTGIGRETARVLALRGADVVMACRSTARGDEARREILASNGGIAQERLEVMELDLASLESTRNFAEAYKASGKSLHLLINNAGVMLPDRRETSDGFEAHFGVNHLGHFLLTLLLLDNIKACAPSRIINLSSVAHRIRSMTPDLEDLNWERRKFNDTRAYGDSKLMNLLFTFALDRRLQGSGAVAHAVHPGSVVTDLARDQSKLKMAIIALVLLPFLKSVGRGAATTVWVATSSEHERKGGGYWAHCGAEKADAIAHDGDLQNRLWRKSEELCGL